MLFFRQDSHVVCQFLASIAANIINITYGISIAWYSSNAAKLQTNQNPLKVPPLTKAEVLWLGTSQILGAVVGTIFLCIMGNSFGRKSTLCVSVIPQLASWMLIMFSTNATELYIARILSGFVGGGSIILTILYVMELAEEKYRGVLLSLLPFSINIGIFIEFTTDYFLSFSEVTYVVIVILTLFIIMLSIFPDTPKQLYKTNKKEKAIKSLQLYRNARELAEQMPDYYRIEVKKIKNILKNEDFTGGDFCRPSTLKALMLAIIFVTLFGFCNYLIIKNFSTNIYLDRVSHDMSVKLSKIIIGFVQVFGTFLCILFVDKIGRKVLFSFSLVGTAISLLFYGFYSYNNSCDFTTLHTNWYPVLLYTCILFFSSFGITPLIYIIIPEIIPNKIRSYGLTFTFTWLWCLEFILMHSGETFIIHLGLHNFALFLASSCLFCLIFVIFVLPETKTKFL